MKKKKFINYDYESGFYNNSLMRKLVMCRVLKNSKEYGI